MANTIQVNFDEKECELRLRSNEIEWNFKVLLRIQANVMCLYSMFDVFQENFNGIVFLDGKLSNP